MGTEGSARRGPRAAEADTRGAIKAAAKAEFTSRGYPKASLRRIAEAAGVDASLVSYYFGSKHGLFLAAMDLPSTPAEVLTAELDGPLDSLGERLVRRLLDVWSAEQARAAAKGVLQSILARPDSDTALLDYATAQLIRPLAEVLGGPDGEYRAILVCAHLGGLGVVRNLVYSSLLDGQTDRLVADLGPMIQHYLTGPLAPCPESSGPASAAPVSVSAEPVSAEPVSADSGPAGSRQARTSE